MTRANDYPTLLAELRAENERLRARPTWEDAREMAAKVAHDFGEENRPTDQQVAASHIEDRIRDMASPIKR